MAQKSAKQLAQRNTKRLNQTHLTTLAIHITSILLRLLRLTFTSRRLSLRSLGLQLLLSLPALAIEFWLERSSRPVLRSEDGSLVRAGEDLDGQGGVMEWCWDVIYWSWGCVLFVGIVGDKGWYAWLVIPLYTVWSLYGAYTGVKSGLGGMMGQKQGQDGAATGSGAQSKRQAKIEKRGGQKMQYR